VRCLDLSRHRPHASRDADRPCTQVHRPERFWIAGGRVIHDARRRLVHQSVFAEQIGVEALAAAAPRLDRRQMQPDLAGSRLKLIRAHLVENWHDLKHSRYDNPHARRRGSRDRNAKPA
jgi:hypothetical protein